MCIVSEAWTQLNSRASGWPGSSSGFSQLLLQLPQALGQGHGQLRGRGASLPGTSSAASGLALGDGHSSHLSPASAALEPPLPAAGRTAERRPSRQPDWRSPAPKGHGHFLGQLCLMQWFCFSDHGRLDVAWVRESPIGDRWDASPSPGSQSTAAHVLRSGSLARVAGQRQGGFGR